MPPVANWPAKVVTVPSSPTKRSAPSSVASRPPSYGSSPSTSQNEASRPTPFRSVHPVVPPARVFTACGVARSIWRTALSVLSATNSSRPMRASPSGAENEAPRPGRSSSPASPLPAKVVTSPNRLHVALHPKPRPLRAPRSHSSPASGSSTPSPQWASWQLVRHRSGSASLLLGPSSQCSPASRSTIPLPQKGSRQVPVPSQCPAGCGPQGDPAVARTGVPAVVTQSPGGAQLWVPRQTGLGSQSRAVAQGGVSSTGNTEAEVAEGTVLRPIARRPPSAPSPRTCTVTALPGGACTTRTEPSGIPVATGSVGSTCGPASMPFSSTASTASCSMRPAKPGPNSTAT